MTAQAFVFAGIEMRAHAAGALFVPSWSTLVVADMHLEKGSQFARRGTFLPPYDSRATLQALAGCIDHFQPDRVLCLGDSFHDRGGPRRMEPEDRRSLERLTAGRDWIWVAGNHDPIDSGFAGGRIAADVNIGSLVFRHEAKTDAAPGEVSGHFHPKASLTVRGRRMSGRCFVRDGRRLILPSFGAFTGGLDVLHPAVRDLMEPLFKVYLIGRHKVHSVSSGALDQPMPGASRPRHI